MPRVSLQFGQKNKRCRASIQIGLNTGWYLHERNGLGWTNSEKHSYLLWASWIFKSMRSSSSSSSLHYPPCESSGIACSISHFYYAWCVNTYHKATDCDFYLRYDRGTSQPLWLSLVIAMVGFNWIWILALHLLIFLSKLEFHLRYTAWGIR